MLTAQDRRTGQRFTLRWSFTVRTERLPVSEKRIRPLRIAGTVTGNYQNAWTDNYNADYYSVNLSTQLNTDVYFYGDLYGRTYSGWYLHNENYLPIDQFAIDTYGRWLDFSVGYLYPYFSALTLDELTSPGLKIVTRLGPVKVQSITVRTQSSLEGTADSWGTFARYATAVQPELSLGRNLSFGGCYLYAWDEVKSITVPGYTVPALGRTRAGYFTSQLTPWWRITTEYAETEYDEDITDTKQPVYDRALVTETVWGITPFVLRVGYRKIGTNYIPLGNSLIDSDREGPELDLEFSFPKMFTSIYAEYRDYENKVSVDQNTGRSKYLSWYGRTYFAIPRWPNLTLSARETIDYYSQRTVNYTLSSRYYDKKTNLSLTLSQSFTYTTGYKTSYDSAGLSLTYRLGNGTIVPTLSYNFYRGWNDKIPATYDKDQTTSRIELLINLSKSITLTTYYQTIRNKDRVATNNNYTEDIASAKLGLRF